MGAECSTVKIRLGEKLIENYAEYKYRVSMHRCINSLKTPPEYVGCKGHLANMT